MGRTHVGEPDAAGCVLAGCHADEEAEEQQRPAAAERNQAGQDAGQHQSRASRE